MAAAAVGADREIGHQPDPHAAVARLLLCRRQTTIARNCRKAWNVTSRRDQRRRPPPRKLRLLNAAGQFRQCQSFGSRPKKCACSASNRACVSAARPLLAERRHRLAWRRSRTSGGTAPGARGRRSASRSARAPPTPDRARRVGVQRVQHDAARRRVRRTVRIGRELRMHRLIATASARAPRRATKPPSAAKSPMPPSPGGAARRVAPRCPRAVRRARVTAGRATASVTSPGHSNRCSRPRGCVSRFRRPPCRRLPG